MELKKIKEDIERLMDLAAGWREEGQPCVLERDLALEILRDLYVRLRFEEQEPVRKAETMAEMETKTVTLRETMAEMETETVAMRETMAEMETETVTLRETMAEMETETVTMRETMAEIETKTVAIAEIMAEIMAEMETRTETMTETITDKEEESDDEIAEMAAEEPIDEITVAAEEQIAAPQGEHVAPPKPVIPRMVDADVIRTLYGSDDITPKTDPSEIIEQPVQAPAEAEAEAEAEHTHAPLPTHLSAAENVGENIAENIAENTQTHKTTLGDVMTGRLTLGETLRNGNQDRASKIAATDTSSLRESIGLNDRFLMIRDMFDGEASAYNEAITALDGFTDMDEAIIYIHDTYNWNADSEGVKLLVNLLERKLN